MGARQRLAVAQALACVLCSCLNAQVPRYVTGDECLFCHRVKVADTWEKNPHARTVHPRDDSDPLPADATFVLGAHAPQRGLKPDGYGKFDLLSRDGKTWGSGRRLAGSATISASGETSATVGCIGLIPFSLGETMDDVATDADDRDSNEDR